MRYIIHYIFSLVLSMNMVLMFTSCSGGPIKEPAKSKRLLRVNLPGEPTTLDPRKGGDIYSSAMHFLLFDGLTKISPTSSTDYGLAHRIDITKDRLTYTFHLRDANWPDGIPITAHDFVYSWTSMLDPSFPCPNANLLYPIVNAEESKKGLVSLDQVGVKALNDKTLVVHLRTPTPYFLNLTSFCVFFPVPKHLASKDPLWADCPGLICNGPYKLVQWKRDHEMVLEKNPYYWNDQDVSLEGVHISFIAHENTALEMFERKELDILGAPYTSIPIDAAHTLESRGMLQAFPVGKTYITAFNVTKEPFNNVHIRKALTLAIDRKSLVYSLSLVNQIPALNFVAPVLKQGKNTPFIQEDPDIASAQRHLEQGLQELSLSKEVFRNVTLLYQRQDFSHTIAQALQQQWKMYLDIDIQLECIDTKNFLTRINSSEFDLCQYYWVAQYDDPMNILDRFKYASNPKNYSCWENQEYIRLLDLSAIVDADKREKVLDEAEKIIMEEAPIAPLFHGSSVRMVQPYIKGIYNSSIGSIHLHKIYFEDTHTESY